MKRAIVFAVALVLSGPLHAREPLAPHKVVSEDSSAGYRVVDVRLDRRLTATELDAIATAINARAQKPGERTFVYFYLPGMKVRGSAWATASFTPRLKVRVAGLTLDEEEALTAEARGDTRNLVGAWLTSAPAAPGKLTIFRERSKVFSEWRLRNGSKTLEELKESRIGTGRRFDNASGGADHYVLLPSGDLELREKDRVVAVAERIRHEADRIASEPQSGIAKAAAAARIAGPGLVPPPAPVAVSSARAAVTAPPAEKTKAASAVPPQVTPTIISTAETARIPTATVSSAARETAGSLPTAPLAATIAPVTETATQEATVKESASKDSGANRRRPVRAAARAKPAGPAGQPAYMRLTQDLFRKPY